ncbi:MAG TPA: chitinase [Kineosporiaceae bacterium]|nr:chitinase [Kineosporiaceae bacterium]
MVHEQATAQRNAPPAAVAPDGPAERLSLLRLGVLILVIAALAGGGYLGIRKVTAPGEPAAQSWGVPYVDVTLTPTYQFQDPRSNPSRNIALAFVVGDRTDGCAPSWGAAYTLDQAATQLELDRRIAQLRAVGGDVMISFGGLANSELAVSCADVDRLTQAYRSVISRYEVNVIDLDIESTALTDQTSVLRRAKALAALQQQRRAGGHDLAIWLTLPVAPTGLTDAGQQVVLTMLREGVSLRGVNVMTMDYGTFGSRPDMLAVARQALQATAGQLAGLYARAGIRLDQVQRWARLGVTPMIGQNDIDNEVFTLDDARGLADFARRQGLGRVSLWSINRDAPCGATFPSVAVHSNTCSGVPQAPLAFTQVYATLPGRAPDAPASDAIVMPTQQPDADDPRTSPYPVWRPSAQYPEKYRVVWHGLVYQAKWFTQGNDPSALLGTGTPNPWALLGPVESHDAAPKPVPTVTGVRTLWATNSLYNKGDRVLFGGLPYQARWLTKGDSPSTEFPVGNDSPWQPLFTIPGEPVTP